MLVSFKSLKALACLAVFGISAAHAQTCISSAQTGTNNGNYFSMWKDSPGSVNFCMAWIFVIGVLLPTLRFGSFWDSSEA